MTKKTTKVTGQQLHDALPESTWFYRRVLMFGFSTLLVGAFLWVTVLVSKMAFANPASTAEAIKSLTSLVIALSWLVGMLMVLYLVAPSGEQIAKMAAMVAALKAGGVSFDAPEPAPQDDPQDPPADESKKDDAGSQDLSSAMEGK